MSKLYYNLNDGKALIEQSQDGNFRVLNSTGEWFSGNGLVEQYFYNGEPGASLITISEAKELAKKFGSSL